MIDSPYMRQITQTDESGPRVGTYGRVHSYREKDDDPRGDGNVWKHRARASGTQSLVLI